MAEFVGGLGPGQVAGRQALGAGSLGELQISLQVNKAFLKHEFEIGMYLFGNIQFIRKDLKDVW